MALTFRLATETIYIKILGSSIIIRTVLIILLNIIYSYAIYDIYSVDDDNLPKTVEKKPATNLKPWQFEIKNQIPKYHGLEIK